MEKYIKDKDLINFEKRTYNNGIETLNLFSLKEFHDVVEIFDKSKDYYIWRGQRKDWKLKSKFDRDYYNKGLITLFKRDTISKNLLKKFKRKLKELKDMQPPPPDFDSLEEDEIWAIGQHYGLLTPLLDWTEEPYIAAYFAFYEKRTNEQCDNRVIYALNKDLERYLHVLKIKNAKKEVISKEKTPLVKFLDLSKAHDDRLDKRIDRQKGIFTKSLKEIDVEENTLDYVKKYPKEDKEIILAKIFIPNKFRRECLKFLKDDKGITHGYLFPDYAGAVEICKVELGLNNSKSSTN